MTPEQEQTIKAYNNSAKEFMQKIGILSNYNDTYDYLIQHLNENDNVLDLACGPAQISKYIKEKVNVNITGVDLSREMLQLAKNNVPDGIFIEDSIITFTGNFIYDAVIIGFGIPYLRSAQVIECIKNSISLVKTTGYLYLSFMHGNKEGFEKTSFGGDNNFYIFHHDKEDIKNILQENGMKIEKEYIIDYKETDGSVTKDIILIGKKE